jgi:hypothetical protein
MVMLGTVTPRFAPAANGDPDVIDVPAVEFTLSTCADECDEERDDYSDAQDTVAVALVALGVAILTEIPPLIILAGANLALAYDDAQDAANALDECCFENFIPESACIEV